MRIFDFEVAKGTGCPYRAVHDGLPHLLPHMSRQRAVCSGATLLTMMGEGVLPNEGVDADPTLKAALSGCTPGSVVLECHVADGGAPLAFSALFAPSGLLRPMVSKAERQSLVHELERRSA